MEQQIENGSELRRYLLGELNHAERLQVEERLFLESDYLQLLQSAEDDLIDEYLYGDLSVAEQERFRQHVLSDPDRAKDIRFAGALKRYIATNAPQHAPALEDGVAREATNPVKPNRSFFGFLRSGRGKKLAWACAVLIVALGGAWLILDLIRQRNQSRPVQAQLPKNQGKAGGELPGEEQPKNEQAGNQEAAPTQEQSAQKAEQNRPQKRVERVGAKEDRAVKRGNEASPPPAGVYVALLIPGSGVRGNGHVNQIRLPAHVGFVVFHLPLMGENNYRSYRAVLQTDGGRSLGSWSGLKYTAESGGVVSLRVPAKMLSQQNYLVILSGVQNGGGTRELSSYSFQILR